MEILLTCRFHSPKEDVAKWDEVLALLADQQWGANLEDVIDYFGPAAVDKLEEMFESFEPDYWSCEWWNRSGEDVEFQLNCGHEAEAFAEVLEDFLSLCRATDVEIKSHGDNDE